MPHFEFEESLELIYGPYVAGIDEAGRGPWAGPVVAASVIVLDRKIFLHDFSFVNDSKLLSKSKREKLFEQLIRTETIQFGIGQASVEEIDRLNILQATFLAMERSLNALTVHACLIDGNQSPKFSIPTQTLIKGDSKSFSIAAASILAKVTRDQIMTELGRAFPSYGWQQNAGYGTAQHQNALQKFGITEHHRKSYAPIKKLLTLCR